MRLEKLVRDIKALKIQGAENISKETAKAFIDIIKESKSRTISEFYSEMLTARKKILSARPTEPCILNTLNFMFYNVLSDSFPEVVKNFLSRIEAAIKHFEESDLKISEIVAKKLPNDSVVFTHCHSSTVVNALIYAKRKGKKFIVNNTETRPFFQGRKTALELSRAGIKVQHFVDSAARLALKKADLMLIGCDAITSEGKIINKIGSELFAEAAHNLGVPVYVCTNSWKFDFKSVFGYELEIEERSKKEVWENPPENVCINNFVFEKVDSSLISGIISELGIFKPEIFIQEAIVHYPYLFKSFK
ncbi:MAG: translation initiation factor eIF-2B [Candidatus Woesearchaeota archaeon]